MNIYNNNFIDNTCNAVISLNQYATTSGILNYFYLKHNNFSNPNSKYELYNNIAYGSQNVFADSNYWGTTNTQHIDSVVYDYFDFANQSVVYYSPILNSSEFESSCLLTTGTELNQIKEFNPALYPNPATIYTTVSFNKTIHEGIIEVFDVFGKNVLQDKIYNSYEKQIYIAGLANGIYLMKLFDGEKFYCKKMIVTHN